MAKTLSVIINGKQYVTQATKEAEGGISSMAKTTDVKSKAMVIAANTVKIAFAGITVAIGGLAILTKKALQEAADMETTTTAFNVLIGDVGRAKKVIADLRNFAAKTPLQFNDITQAATSLMAFGSAADDVRDQISMLGDIAMGQSDKLESIVRAYGKIQAKGKASMEELNMVTEAGVPILGELSDLYGVTVEELLKMVTAGKVGFGDVDQAFKNMTSSGGQFYGMLDKQSQTFNGMVSTLKDNLSLIMQRLGESILPTAVKMLEGALDALDNFITSGALDDIALKLAIFATQTFAVFANIGVLIEALFLDIRQDIDELFSPNVMSKIVDYLEYGMNNMLSMLNLPLKLSDKLWGAMGLPETKKFGKADWTPEDTSPSNFDIAMSKAGLDMGKIANDVTTAFNNAKKSSAEVLTSGDGGARSQGVPYTPRTPSTGLSSGLTSFMYPWTYGINPSEMTSTNKWAPSDTEESSGFGNVLKDQLKSVFDSSGIGDLFKAPLGVFADLGASIIPLISSFSSVNQLLNPLQTIFGGMMEVLEPVIDTILAPLVGILKIVGQTIGQILVPVLQWLTPIIELVGEIFIWLYNKIILPIGNGLITVFNVIGIGLTSIVNGVISAINWALGWAGVNIGKVGVPNIDDGYLSAIDSASLYDAGGASGSDYTGGGTGSSTSVQSVVINVYQNFNGTVIGDGGLESVGEFVVQAIQAYSGVGGTVKLVTA